MSRETSEGTCDKCGALFQYYLIHNGFNDSAYAYSDSTTYTVLLDGWKVPSDVPVKIQGTIQEKTEEYLLPAPDGGIFRASASPRCPLCGHVLDPIAATKYIEANAEGTKGGWRWQKSWDGIYCIVIENRVVHDAYKK